MALTDSLVSHWALNEASGNALDSHSTNHLTETGGTIASATGKVGNCRDFEAADTEWFSHADGGDFDIGDVDFTFACWVNFESLSRASIISKGLGVTSGEFYLLYETAVSRLEFEVYGGINFGNGTAVAATDTGIPSTGVWYFIVFWHDSVGNTINLQVNNGTLNSAAHTTGVYQTTGTFTVGADETATYTDGLIDEVSFWKRVLTADERTELYNSGNGLAYPWTSGQPAGRRFGKGNNGLWLPRHRPIEIGRKGVNVF